MKSGTTGRKVGPLKIMNGFHADGAPLELKVLVRASFICIILIIVGIEIGFSNQPLSCQIKLCL